MKFCSRCKTEKPKSSFWRQKSAKDGLQSSCIECYKQTPSRTKGTLAFFKRQSWQDINRRTVNGQFADMSNYRNKCYLENDVRVEMSKDEFYDFCETNKRKILKLYKEGHTPSIDRIDPTKNYEIGNIQVMSLSENVRKSNKGGSK